MKILIFSDSHRQFAPLMQVMEREVQVDRIIHAGDVCQDAEDLEIMYPSVPVIAVKGNNDYFNRDFPEDRFFELGGVKIFLTHGHNYGVKYSYSKVWQVAREKGADICIFGHTHKAHQEKLGGVELFNPGSSGRSYGVLEIDEKGYTLKLCEL